MNVKYCRRCGAERTDHSRFCGSCGAPFEDAPGGNYDYRYDYPSPNPPLPRHLPLSCILAYVPFLFWLPLVADRRDPLHRRCANQGLWLTLTSLIYYIGLFVVWSLLNRNAGVNWAELCHTLFLNWTPDNWLSKLPSMLGAQVTLAFALTPLANSLSGIFRGLGSDRPYQIPVFGRFQLIRPKLKAARHRA